MGDIIKVRFIGVDYVAIGLEFSKSWKRNSKWGGRGIGGWKI